MPGEKRPLLCEAQVLLSYVLGQAPGSVLICRYFRALRAQGQDCPLPLSLPPARWAFLLYAFEPVGRNLGPRATALSSRIRIASVIAESSTQGARKFYADSRLPRSVRLFILTLKLLFEFLIFPVRLALTRWMR